MKVFVAVLALVAAAAAAPEMGVAPAAAPVAPMAASTTPLTAPFNQQRAVEEGKVFSVYGAPSFATDAYLEEEEVGIKGLYKMPFFVVAKNFETNVFETYLLKDGFHSLYTPEFAFLRNQFVSGNKFGLLLSAVRYLDMPELNMPLFDMKLPKDFTLAGLFQYYRKATLKAPVMVLSDMDAVRSFSFDKLTEIGAFSLFSDKVQIYKDYTPAAFAAPAPVATHFRRIYSPAPQQYIVQEQPEFPYTAIPARGAAAPSQPSRYRVIAPSTPAWRSQQAESYAPDAEEAVPAYFNAQRFPFNSASSSPSIVYIA